MTEPTTPYNSAILKCLDVFETELGAIRTRQPVTMEDYRKAREEFEELLYVRQWAHEIIKCVITLLLSKGLMAELKLATSREAEAEK